MAPSLIVGVSPSYRPSLVVILERHGDKSPTEKRWLAGNFEGQGSPEHAAAGLGGASMHNQATRSKLAEILRGQANRADARAKEAYKAPEKATADDKQQRMAAYGRQLRDEHEAAKKHTNSLSEGSYQRHLALGNEDEAARGRYEHEAYFHEDGRARTEQERDAHTQETIFHRKATTTPEKPQDAPKAEAGGDGKDTPKQAYTAPQAAGQGAGAAAPDSTESRDAKVDRAFHEGAAKATGGLGEEVRPLDRNIHGMAAMLKEAGAGDVSPMDAYQHYYNGDVLNASDGLTPTRIRKGMEHHAKGMADSRQREMGYMHSPDTSNDEYRAERHGDPEKHAREIFDTQFKAKYPGDRLRSKNYNEKWAQLHNTALSMAHSNIAQAHDDAATTIERDAARNGPDERMRNGLESAKTVARHAKALNPESEGAKELDDYSTAMDARLKSHDDASKVAVKRLRDKAAHHRAEAQRHAALHNAGKGAVREAFTLTPRIGGYSAPVAAR